MTRETKSQEEPMEIRRKYPSIYDAYMMNSLYDEQPTGFGWKVCFGREAFGFPTHEQHPHTSSPDTGFGLLAKELLERQKRERELKAQVEKLEQILEGYNQKIMSLKDCWVGSKQEFFKLLDDYDRLKTTYEGCGEQDENELKHIPSLQCPKCIDDAKNTTLGRETDCDDDKKPLDATTDTEKVTDTSQTVPDLHPPSLPA